MPQKFSIALILLATSCLNAFAQDAEVASQYSKNPFGIVWYTSFNQMSMMEYISTLGQQHGLEMPWQNDEQMRKQMDRFSEKSNGISEAKAKGSIWLLKKGLLPTPVSIEFRTVESDEEFRKLVLMSKNRFGPENDRVKMEGSGDKYSVIYKWGDEEGQGISTYFLLRGGVMFTAGFEDVQEMELPSSKKLGLSGSRAKYDVLAEFDFKQIPRPYKEIAWNMLSAQSGTMLQQYDYEEDDVYDFRRSAGDLGLSAVKECLFDIERLDFKLRLIDDGQPLNFEADLEVKDNSSLSKTLSDIGKGSSRFAPVLNDDAAITISSTWRMPDALTDLGVALANLIRAQTEQNGPPSDAAKASFMQVAEMLEDTAKKQRTDFFLKFGMDSTGDLAFYGAMGIEGYSDLVKTMPGLMEEIPNLEPTEEQTENGVIFTIPVPSEFWTNDLGIDSGVVDLFPSKLNFMFGKSALWLSFGRENSASKITDVIAALNERNGGLRKPQQLALNINAEDWVNSDPGSKPKLAFKKLELMLDNMADMQAQRFRRNFSGKKQEQKEEPETSLFSANKNSRSFVDETLGTDGFARLALTTGKKSVHLEGEVGDGMARFVMVRMLVMQTRQMEVMRRRNEEMRKKALETQKNLEKAAKDSN